MIKQMILKRIGKIWKDTRGKLFHQFYDGTKTLEQNIAQCPEGIDPSNWKWSLEYRMRADTQERLQGRRISRGEIWNKVHKRKDVSYIHNNVQTTRVFFWLKLKELNKNLIQAEKGLLMLLDSDLPALKVDFRELQNSKWRASN
ncbi:uncharacterized protein [Arachis hypogaea]|uniref:uncharacterized protein n=1 Tax=Arachis hypogaea TaxID=3818 RepID=UPI003B2245CB